MQKKIRTRRKTWKDRRDREQSTSFTETPAEKGNPAGITACAGNVCGKPDTDPDHLRGMWYCR